MDYIESFPHLAEYYNTIKDKWPVLLILDGYDEYFYKKNLVEEF